MPAKRLLLFTLGLLLFTMPLLVMAQEETGTEAAAPAEPFGLTTLVFLLGMLAIVVVGGVQALRRDSASSEKGS